MKTKIIVLSYVLFSSIVMNAHTVALQGEPDVGTISHRDSRPIVDYSQSFVSIKSKIFIGNVRVIITDTMGHIIYNKVLDLLPDSNVLDIPEEYASDKYKIELYYDKSKLYGFFQDKE